MASPQQVVSTRPADRTRLLSPETRLNPKRCAAHQSVSLRHVSPPTRTAANSQSLPQCSAPCNSSPTSQSRLAERKPQATRSADHSTLPTRSRSALAENDSQQLGRAAPSAWFDQSNTNVQPSQDRTAFFDSEPPFFLSHVYPSSGSDVGDDDSPPAAVFDRNDSENDDLRNIIDDLTVENKDLKQRLKRYERLHPMVTENERLLEVRMHGLSADRKRDLEALLRKFVTTIHASPDQQLSRKHKIGYGSFSKGQSSNSMTNSHNRTTDSGYQSMSASHPSNGSNPTISAPLPQHNKNKNVKSYLSHLPTIQHPPKDMASLPEKVRMKLVVRRLEDLFTGTPVTQATNEKADHTQARQQQQVSEDAATADRKTAAATGHRGLGEGSREARMMPPGAPIVHKAQKSDDSPDSSDTKSGDDSPDQRPTRPLDLDVSRSHNANETMDYIRHLGLADDRPEATPSQSGDWVWLNLLISMAQLHTMNVTPEFIRKSVSELSDKFELSSDGRKLRWTGGVEGTKLSSESEADSSVYGVSGSSPEDERSPGEGDAEGRRNKRRKLDLDYEMTRAEPTSLQFEQHIRDEQGDDPSNNTRAKSSNLRMSKSHQNQPEPFMPYRPIFHGLDKIIRRNTSSDSTSSDSGTNSETKYQKSSGDGVPSSSDDSPGIGDGPVIFYRSPLFCRDLSADRQGVKRALGDLSSSPSRDDVQVLGLTLSSLQSADSCSRSSDFHSLASERESSPSQSIEAENDASSPLPALEIAKLEGHRDTSLQTNFMDFEASGLGGVMPNDNFGIRVFVRQAPIKNSNTVAAKRYPTRATSGIPPQLSRYQSTVLSTNYAALKASRLPAPSFIVFSSSSGEFDDDSEDNTSEDGSASESEIQSLPAPASFLKEFSSLEESLESSNESMESEETGLISISRSDLSNDISFVNAPMRWQSSRSVPVTEFMEVDGEEGDNSDDDSENSKAIDSSASIASSSLAS